MAARRNKKAPKNTTSTIATTIIFLAALGYLCFMLSVYQKNHRVSVSQSGVNTEVGKEASKEVLALVQSQAEIIQRLTAKIEQLGASHKELDVDLQALRSRSNQALSKVEDKLSLEHEIRSLKRDLEVEKSRRKNTIFPPEKQTVNVQPPPSNGANMMLMATPKTSHDQMCYNRFSWGLLDIWKSKKETWCESNQGPIAGPLDSKLECYPYHQEGKPKSGLFCEATNFFIDFNKVRGDHGKTKPSIPQQYLDFGTGATFATCKKTNNFKDNKLMNHMKKQLSGKNFFDNQSPPPQGSYEVVRTPTYLLARDEDCENMFHAMADHLNVYEVAQMLGLDFRDLQIVLWDKHPDTAFKDLYQTAFAPNHPVKRQRDFSGTVLFERLIFHLESPAGQVHVGMLDPWTCRDSELFAAFRAHVLKAYDLWDVPPPKKPQVTLSVRRRTAEKNVGRVCANEAELEKVLREGNMMDYQVVDLGTKSFREQLKIMRNTNVLVGIHGAGHMHAYFLAEEAVLAELHPPYRLDRHFRNAARMNGKIYLPYRVVNDKISCKGSSDAITINANEFRKVMDGALRLARNFHGGLSECGLWCDPNILALDKNLIPLYKPGDGQVKNPKKPRFPC